jgi:hypothetical protein
LWLISVFLSIGFKNLLKTTFFITIRSSDHQIIRSSKLKQTSFITTIFMRTTILIQSSINFLKCFSSNSFL